MPATPRTTLAARLVAQAVCRACHRTEPLDLAGLVERGHGNTPLIELPLRCRCGARGHDVIVSHPGRARDGPSPLNT